MMDVKIPVLHRTSDIDGCYNPGTHNTTAVMRTSSPSSRMKDKAIASSLYLDSVRI
jgi:hypothetical protein